MLGDLVHRPARHQEGFQGGIALHDGAIGLTSHLNIAHRIVEVGISEVPIVDGDCFLEHRGVGLMGQGHHRLAVVIHVIAPHLIGAIGQALGVLIIGRHQQQPGTIGGTAAHHNHITADGHG